jgi:NADP-dependent 3-hydroxy acid dehydrogenase YdfG
VAQGRNSEEVISNNVRKVVAITGASSGSFEATAQHLRANDASFVLANRASIAFSQNLKNWAPPAALKLKFKVSRTV